MTDAERRFRKWSLVTNVVLAGVAVLSLFAFGWQLKLSRDNFISDKRAWVPADIVIAGPLTWKSGGGSVPFRFTLRNTGHTPALNVTINARLFQSRVGLEPNPVEEQKNLSENVLKHPPRDGLTIFPGDTLPEDISYQMSQDEIEQMRAWWKKNNPTSEVWLTPVLVGCINYQLVFGGDYHQTGFILEVNKIDPARGGLLSISPDKGDIPAELLRITFSPLGDGITN